MRQRSTILFDHKTIGRCQRSYGSCSGGNSEGGRWARCHCPHQKVAKVIYLATMMMMMLVLSILMVNEGLVAIVLIKKLPRYDDNDDNVSGNYYDGQGLGAIVLIKKLPM